MTKKTVITALSLLLVLALLIVGYTLLKNKNERDAAESDNEQEAAVFVNIYDSSDLVSMTYSNKSGDLSFTKDANDAWHLKDDVNYPLDQTYVSNMANSICGLRAERAINSEESPEFGFESPVLKVAGEFKDGTQLSLTVGATNSFNGNVYLKDDVNSNMYLVESGFPGTFDYSMEDLMLTDTFPSIDNENLVSMTVTNSDGKQTTVTDSVGLKDSAEIFERLNFASENAFYCEADKMADYGIVEGGASAQLSYREKVSVTNDDGTMSSVMSDASFKIIFGDRHTVTESTSDGTESEQVYYYYTTPGSNIVYSAKEAVFAELMRYAEYVAPESDTE